jgi:hypothetical protein
VISGGAAGVRAAREGDDNRPTGPYNSRTCQTPSHQWSDSMGYNRAGTKRRARLKRHKREQERLAKKYPPTAQTEARPQPQAPQGESK